MLGLDWECRTPEECGKPNDGRSKPTLSDSVLGDSGDTVRETEEEEEVELRTYKDPSTYRDQQSTGRKQAAKKFPLDEDALCEWAMKKNCGGGDFPITGCLANSQQARHHGPDKNTLNNENGNVHRICHTCHNRWHTLNDADYVWGKVYDLHAPRDASPIDIGENEIFWQNRQIVKAKD